MKKILVAYDGTEGAEAAMLDLIRGGFPDEAEAKVLAVADVWLPPEPLKPPFPDRVAASQVETRQNALDELAAARVTAIRGAERLHNLFPRWKIEHIHFADSPAWGILAEVKRWGANLVAIGSHGRSPLQKFFLGSVSQKVAAEAACSVRVFRKQHGTDDALRIAIALDGSPDSDAAFDEALARTWPAGTSFELITVVDPRVKVFPIMDAGVVLPAPESSPNEWVGTMLSERAARLKLKGFAVSTQVLEGEAKSAFLRHAEQWKADCIFLGARGIQHGDRLYLGTFASAIVTRAHCTVEITRRAQ